MMESTASETLDRIRDGGTYILSVCRQRLTDAVQALEEGQFDLALSRAKEATARIGVLANAQSNVGDFAEARIVRASEIDVGMQLYGWGAVEGLTPADQPDDQDPLIKFQTEDGEKLVHADAELVVRQS